MNTIERVRQGMEVKIIPVRDEPGRFIIFRPRIGLAFIGNQAMVNLALKRSETDAAIGPDEVESFLETIGFFIQDPPEPIDDNMAFRPTTAVLLMTNQCQLRCTYCYASAGEMPSQALTFAQGKVAIDYVCQSALDQGRSEFEVSFHGGGEPTFAWKVLKACTEYARQKPLAAKITLTSNGIWSRKQCEWIVHNLDGVSLSLDGSAETQDSQRPLINGQGSSALVMRTAAELDRHQFSYGIRMTATAPWSRLPRDVQFLCENTQCNVIQVEPAFNTERGGHGAIIPQDEAQAFASACLEAFEIANRLGRRFTYSGARLGVVTTAFCKAPFQALIINGSGDIVTCYEVASSAHELAQLSIIGHVENDTVVIDDAARSHLHRLMAERRDTCRDCFCYWSCAGDCYARVFQDVPGGHLIHGERCSINQLLTEKLLLQRLAANGGIWRAGLPQPVPLSAMNPEVLA